MVQVKTAFTSSLLKLIEKNTAICKFMCHIQTPKIYHMKPHLTQQIPGCDVFHQKEIRRVFHEIIFSKATTIRNTMNVQNNGIIFDCVIYF